MKKLIYSIEDDKDIAFIIKTALENASYEVVSFSDGESFLNEFKNKKPDLILLDMMLPKISGQEILKIIRKDSSNNNIDVIIISANKLLNDKVDGLNLGADDYIEKPFEILELISRVNARFRKYKSNIYEVKDLIIDEDKHKVLKSNEEIFLTSSEYEILLELVKEKGKVLTREKIIEKLWGNQESFETRTIDMHIKNIRKKLHDNDIIITIHGLGYRINE